MVLNESEPVYQQIVQYVKIKIHLGVIQNGDELVSRRTLAATLGINPNTVQKAYKILEESNILTTGSNVKSVVIVNEQVKETIQNELTKVAAKDFVNYVKKINLSFKDTIELITHMWDE
jgi:DNA-binding transcriptional regulator YhcF (GntR family)